MHYTRLCAMSFIHAQSRTHVKIHTHNIYVCTYMYMCVYMYIYIHMCVYYSRDTVRGGIYIIIYHWVSTAIIRLPEAGFSVSVRVNTWRHFTRSVYQLL